MTISKEDLGLKLKSIREKKGISTYLLVKNHKIRFESIQAIEKGSSNYTIDSLINYIVAIECVIIIENENKK